ncbi:MAG: class I SAM-dependent methyltransferase [Bdellovibrionales bacterium]|nr:class I SAM-dependent methyltransferase [Bdellovibrionales bacterium]
MDKFIIIDEEGYFVLSQGIRLTDAEVGRKLFEQLYITDTLAVKTRFDNEDVFVEAFDKPLVAAQVSKENGRWTLIGPYEFEAPFDIKTLCLDEWDRFHGLTEKRIPFVFSRKAQAEFFNLLDEFSDETITIDGKTYEIPPFYIEDPSFKSENTWNNIYANNPQPNWDLSGAHPAIAPILPQLKMVKSRVVNFGCGRAHDAAALAHHGHVVTGVDYSPQALAQAREKYSSISTLTLLEGDALKMKVDRRFDIAFEHTLFCALMPSQRKELIRQWHRALDDQGFLLGIFFVMPKRAGPPYGCSEWELRELFENKFRPLFWKRWQQSPPHRQGTELVIYAQKISN